MLDCGNYGTKTVQVDPARPQDLYTLFFCQGVWKSTNYGQTWEGPINTGSSGATLGDCAGGIAIAPGESGGPPLLYASCIRGNALGFWRSTNGGVDWTRFAGPDGSGQQFYPPVVDPYDSKHLMMTGHAVDLLAESSDGGQTWSAVKTDPKMAGMGGTGEIEFINTGKAETTRTTWLWLAAASGGKVGTWRTEDSGATWTKVETNEHINGSTQVYQPDTSGVMYMAGVYSENQWGVLRSDNYGKTWVHVGGTNQETIVFGTTKRVYAMYGAGVSGELPSMESAPQPGSDGWLPVDSPAWMTLGPVQAAVTNDGMSNIVVTANTTGGILRYVEP